MSSVIRTDVTAGSTAGADSESFNFAHDVVEGWARVQPEAVALWHVCEGGGAERKLTFAELGAKLRQAANFMGAMGIRRGDRVLIMLPRVPEWWVAVLGLLRLGAIPIPGTPLLTAKDVAYRLEVAGVKAVVTDGAGAGKVDPAFAGVRLLVKEGDSSDLPGWTDFAAYGRAATTSPYYPTAAHDPAVIYFTSGTTGHAKMVVHTHASYGRGHVTTGKYWLDLHPGDVIWALADTGWGKTAWSSLFGPWLQGATVFTLDMRGKFDPTAVLKTLAGYPISVFCSPATALRLIVRKDIGAYKFSRLRHCVSAGEALNPPVLKAWREATGLTIYEGYGQTETVCIVGNFRVLGHEVRAGSMGRAAPGWEVAIVNEEGLALPAQAVGQIAVRVKPERPLGLFAGYWQNPEETAARFVGDYYLTGDTGYHDGEGYFYFVGRADDVINSSSYRIGPTEVESALQEHPAVLESAAIGVPEELRGEIVRAYVVLRPGYRASEKLKKELQAHCKKVTAPYKYPRQIEFIAELPKTISGKIRRVELRAQAALDAKRGRPARG